MPASNIVHLFDFGFQSSMNAIKYHDSPDLCVAKLLSKRAQEIQSNSTCASFYIIAKTLISFKMNFD